MEQNSPAKELENFLNFIDQCVQEYKAAYENVNEEDRRLQDLVHAIEFAVDKSERNRVATKFQQSRKYRRQNKDIVKRNERIVKFFEEQKNRDTLNRMRQLLGQGWGTCVQAAGRKGVRVDESRDSGTDCKGGGLRGGKGIQKVRAQGETSEDIPEY
ncbi:hypothetical protein [Hungatella hathewayi]|uniref:hypothetical protein n=1 Tax=Hungatella hathewayi TaxID=154046 RepID=UPI0022E7CFF2|nr:hypothetical protein [Hungatella hathewayi]